ncbi:MAG TPA: hypothetical protein DDZ80_24555 [Cyanobacteria bacterium UBA8803]|nr:hypothetical protein [Cyanobacteria bacterium UBA9273]HBL61481.1 hypothetical protein [Cyanobacteria bacterium UBA8803]
MTIKNRSFFPYVDFFPAENFKLIGECADKKVLLIGKVKGYGDPIVAICETDEPSQEELSACDLYELMKFSQSKVNLTEAT